MSYAMMGGLLVATVLTLIFLPALYIAWFRVRNIVAQRAHRALRWRAPGLD
jgi:Cu/Ag efflux pump CusA